MLKQCIACGKEFIDRSDAKIWKYCSHYCNNSISVKADRINREWTNKRICSFCWKEFVVWKFMWWRAKYCSTICNKRNFYLKNIKVRTSKLIDRDNNDYKKTTTWMGELREKRVHSIIGWERSNKDIWSSLPDIYCNWKSYDVKSINAFKRSIKSWYYKQRAFQLCNKIKPDYYILLLLEYDVILACYIIPSNKIGNGITIGINSEKYRIYKDNNLFNELKTC